MRVILDTNMLMVPGELGVDIIREIDRIIPEKHTVCVLQASVDELERLAKGASKVAQRAKLALSMIKQLNFKVIKKTGYADDLLVEEAEKKDTIIATQDAELKRRLKALDLPHIVLRQKQYLELKA